jgi:hypothetical protein
VSAGGVISLDRYGRRLGTLNWTLHYRVKRQTVEGLLARYGDVCSAFARATSRVSTFTALMRSELEKPNPFLERIRMEAAQVQDEAPEIRTALRGLRDALQVVFKYVMEPCPREEDRSDAQIIEAAYNAEYSSPALRYLEPTYEQIVLQEHHVDELRAFWSRWDEDMSETTNMFIALGELVNHFLQSMDLARLRQFLSSLSQRTDSVGSGWHSESNRFRRKFWLPEPFGLSWPRILQYDPPTLLASFIKVGAYDLDIPLKTLIERISSPDLANLLTRLPPPGKEGLRESPMSTEELGACTLRMAATQILNYQAAYVGEMDAGWFELGRQPRIGFKRLRNVLAMNESASPTTLREALELLESNRGEVFDSFTYYSMPNDALDKDRDQVDIVNKSEWVVCEACGRKTPAHQDRLPEENGPPKIIDTYTYVCAFCGHVRVGTISCDPLIKEQTVCHNCDTSLGDDYQCPKCAYPRGWKVVRCSDCGNTQPTYVPPLFPLFIDEPHIMDCVECERRYTDWGIRL